MGRAMAEQTSVWMDGQLVPRDQAAVSVFDHGVLYGDGVFEGIRIYGGKIFKCATHLRRLYDSAKAIAMEIPYRVDEIDAAMRQTMQHNRVDNGYIRICVTRGVGDLGLNPRKCARPTVFIIADRIQLYPQEMYETGLEVVTAATIRTHPASLSPRIKSMNYLNNILAQVEALRAGCVEAVMLNHLGYVAECTGDNIFTVREGQLATPPLHAGILEGVTRNAVMELADQAGMTVREMDLTRYDLYVADEVFLTGTAAEIIPVTKIDDRVIGTGVAGPVMKQLLEAFRNLVKDAPED